MQTKSDGAQIEENVQGLFDFLSMKWNRHVKQMRETIQRKKLFPTLQVGVVTFLRAAPSRPVLSLTSSSSSHQLELQSSLQSSPLCIAASSSPSVPKVVTPIHSRQLEPQCPKSRPPLIYSRQLEPQCPESRHPDL